jgi:hypothetical protein
MTFFGGIRFELLRQFRTQQQQQQAAATEGAYVATTERVLILTFA